MRARTVGWIAVGIVAVFYTVDETASSNTASAATSP